MISRFSTARIHSPVSHHRTLPLCRRPFGPIIRTATTHINVNEPPATVQSKSINISDACAAKLKDLCSGDEFLRVIVDNGGCSGFQYKFELDRTVNEDDVTFGANDHRVVVDSISLNYCDGATLDYHSELIKAGFRITSNPKAEQGCSCGVSFALKMD